MSEGVYLIHPREFIKTNENVYKLGRSIHLDNRVKQYPNGSYTLLMLNCNNSIVCEKYLINLFKTKFIQKTYYGTEYFEGNKKIMIREIINYINIVYDEEDAVDFEIVKNSEKVEKIKKLKENNIKQKNIKIEVKEGSDRTCPKCNYIFKFPNMLKKHFRNSFHCLLNEDEIKLFFNPVINTIKCDICLKEFSQKCSLLRHKRNIKCSKSQAQA